MKSLIIAAIIVLLCSSTALGGWHHRMWMPVPAPMVVHSYYPAGPVYAYPPPVVSYSPTVAYMPPVMTPYYVGYPPGAFAPAPVVFRPRVFYYGQPIRNVFRAVLP